MHKHARQAFSPIATLAPSPDASLQTTEPPMTAGDRVMSDIQKIESGLHDLPQDLMALVQTIEQRLQQVENLLQGLLQPNQTLLPSPPESPTFTTSSPVVSSSASSSEESPTLITTFPTASLDSVNDNDVYVASSGGPTMCWWGSSWIDCGLVPATTSEKAPPVVALTSGGDTFSTIDDTFTTTDDTFTISHSTSTTTITITSKTSLTTTLYAPATVGNVVTSAATNSTAPLRPHRPSRTDLPATWSLPDPTVSASTFVTLTTSVSTPAYTFDANARNNVAVYYGTTPATEAGGLSKVCGRDEVDIVILSFLFAYFGPGDYPSIDFEAGCNSTSAAQRAVGATGLSDCSMLGDEIQDCQRLGKKVLLSLGGYIANSTFDSDDQATGFAGLLWNLFGGGTEEDASLRPFGPEVIVDGFDIDNENHNTAHYDTFATSLRQNFAQDLTKTYYISAAPQCPIPDEAIPLGVMAIADFVWVQFYNNPSCNLDSSGFLDSFAAWSQNLSAIASAPGGPKLYIGAAAYEGAGSGYVVGSRLETLVDGVKASSVPNFGGLMLWDGSEAMENVDSNGADYLVHAKKSLQG